VSISLDQWREAPFYLTDKDLAECMEGTIPMQASEAIKSLANFVDAYILNLYKGIYGFAGTPGATPFGSDHSDITAARKVLNNQLAPLGDRRFVFDADCEANALNLRAFTDISFTGDARAINEGEIVHKFGFDWFLDQNVPTHIAGTPGGTLTVNGAHAVGLSILSMANTAAGNLAKGDIITIAGDSQTYVVGADVTWAGAGNENVAIAPPLQVGVSGSEAVTVKASHVVNMTFHRDAIAFANRPLADNTNGLGNLIQTAQDPKSGLSLRLEFSREHKQTRFSYDILFGAAVVRPQLACRLAG
ncbi:MAG: P22 phage major capsid protein family protein, partial [Spirochaetota bacterium]